MIALFGSNGYLGRQLAFYLAQLGETIDAFDLPDFDVANDEAWRRFAPRRYSAIYFFAGLTGTERGFAEAAKYLFVNELGLLNLLKSLAPLGEEAPKVIFPSTRLVYRGSPDPLKEDAPKAPKTIYAVNKLACEHYLEAYANRVGLPYAVARICVPYGNLVEADYAYGTIGFFMKQLKAGLPITLFGGGKVRRTFTHVADICRSVTFLAKTTTPSGIYNIGGEALSLEDVARLFIQQFGRGSIKSIPWPPDAERLESGDTVFASTKLDALWGEGYQNLSNDTSCLCRQIIQATM